jgi:hypothetical protein
VRQKNYAGRIWSGFSLNLNEALSLIDDLEGSLKESRAVGNGAVDFPKLYLMESFQPFAEGYTLCIKKQTADKAAFGSLLSLVKVRGLDVTSLCERYWVIYSPKL